MAADTFISSWSFLSALVANIPFTTVSHVIVDVSVAYFALSLSQREVATELLSSG